MCLRPVQVDLGQCTDRVQSHVIGEPKKNVRFVRGRVCSHAGAEKGRSEKRFENRVHGVKKLKLTGREHRTPAETKLGSQTVKWRPPNGVKAPLPAQGLKDSPATARETLRAL